MGILTTPDKDKIKRCIPKATNKIIDATVARLYIAYPDPTKWVYTEMVGAITLVDDLVGNTFFLKMVDILGNTGVIWDQELWVGFEYNQDRKYFHTFEIDDCLVGLLFEDTNDATHFFKRVSSRQKYGSKHTINNKNAIALKSKVGPLEAKVGPRGEYVDVHSAQRLRRSKGVLYYDDLPPPEWRSLYAELESAGITQDMIADNREFIKEYIAKQGGPLVGLEPPIPRKFQVEKSNSVKTVGSTKSKGKKAKAPPPPPPAAASAAGSMPAPEISSPETTPEPSRESTVEPESEPEPEPSAPAQPRFRLPPANAVPPVRNLPPVSTDRPLPNLPDQSPVAASPTQFKAPPASTPFKAPPRANFPPAPPGRTGPPPPPVRTQGPPPPARGQVPPPPPRAGAQGVPQAVTPQRTGAAPAPPPPRRGGAAPPPPPPRASRAPANVPQQTTPQQQAQQTPFSPPAQQIPPPPQRQAVSQPAPPPRQAASQPPPPPPMPAMNSGAPPPPPLPPMNTSGAPPPPPMPAMNSGAPPPPPMPAMNSGAPPPPPMPPMNTSGAIPPPPPMGGTAPLPQVDGNRDALLASIRGAGIGALKKTDKSQLEKPSVLLQEAKGEPVAPPPSGNAPPGQPASLADALAAALNKRKGKVGNSDDEDDEDWD